MEIIPKRCVVAQAFQALHWAQELVFIQKIPVNFGREPHIVRVFNSDLVRSPVP
jgi:hypothetical protein